MVLSKNASRTVHPNGGRTEGGRRTQTGRLGYTSMREVNPSHAPNGGLGDWTCVEPWTRNPLLGEF